jgi:hypothetical protein
VTGLGNDAAPSNEATERKEEQPLPRRDWILLPGISLLTLLLMLSIAEVCARAIWPAEDSDSCNLATGRFRPNCSSKVKAAEGPWIENRYNDCGYRSMQSCGPRKKDTVRVVVLGTSLAYGYLVPYQDVYSTVEGQSLTRRCGRSVEFQNIGYPATDMLTVYRRTDEALALKPDLLILAISPFDIRYDISAERLAHRDDPQGPSTIDSQTGKGNFLKRTLVTPIKESRAVYMLQHFMYQDPATYLKLYLLYGDGAGFLRTTFSPAWQQRFANFDTLLAGINAKAHAASVPMLILLGPSAAEVAASDQTLKPRIDSGLDAEAFSREISTIASRYQLPVVQPLEKMRGVPKPMSLFYVVDGHLNADGQKIVADALDAELLSGKYPILSSCKAH